MVVVGGAAAVVGSVGLGADSAATGAGVGVELVFEPVVRIGAFRGVRLAGAAFFAGGVSSTLAGATASSAGGACSGRVGWTGEVVFFAGAAFLAGAAFFAALVPLAG
jgi:hypothetical protein